MTVFEVWKRSLISLEILRLVCTKCLPKDVEPESKQARMEQRLSWSTPPKTFELMEKVFLEFNSLINLEFLECGKTVNNKSSSGLLSNEVSRPIDGQVL